MKKRIDILDKKTRIDRWDLGEWINSEQEDMDEVWDYLEYLELRSEVKIFQSCKNFVVYDRRQRYF